MSGSSRPMHSSAIFRGRVSIPITDSKVCPAGVAIWPLSVDRKHLRGEHAHLTLSAPWGSLEGHVLPVAALILIRDSLPVTSMLLLTHWDIFPLRAAVRVPS